MTRPRAQRTSARSTRLASVLALASLALAGLMLWVPPAAAQDQKMQVDTKIVSREGIPLVPEVGKATLRLRTTLSISAGAGCILPIKVTWSRGTAPSYATLVFNPTSMSKTLNSNQTGQPIADLGGSRLVYETDVFIMSTRDAPAFQDANHEIMVHVEAGQATTGSGCNLENPADTSVVDVVRSGYIAQTHVTPGALSMKSGQNKKVVFPIDVANMGNGPTRVRIELSPSGRNLLDSMNAGPELRLESKAGRGPGAQYKVARYLEVQTPHSTGYENAIYSFRADFVSTYDGPVRGTTAVDETSLTFTVQVQGVHVPGFDGVALLLGLALALAGVAVRRRQG
jgi:hypothetical protein